jgi:hypothetical protein
MAQGPMWQRSGLSRPRTVFVSSDAKERGALPTPGPLKISDAHFSQKIYFILVRLSWRMRTVGCEGDLLFSGSGGNISMTWIDLGPLAGPANCNHVKKKC